MNKEINSITLKRALISDADKILALQKRAFKPEADLYNNYSIPALIQTLNEMKEDIKTKRVIKAEIDNEIIGSVRAYQINGTCFIGMLIVHPAYQNKGIGSKLLNTIELEFGHVTRYELFTGYKSQKNIKLYEKLGYLYFKKDEYLVYMEKTN